MSEAWSPYSVPERKAGSRFFVETSPGGWAYSKGEVLGMALGLLLGDRMDEARAFAPPKVELALKQVVYVQDTGEWVLAERGSVSRRPAWVNRRPSRVWRKIKDPGVLLDRFFLGDPEVWAKATDRELFEAARDCCEADSIRDATSLRTVNTLLALLLGVRLGLDLSPEDLPLALHVVPSLELDEAVA